MAFFLVDYENVVSCGGLKGVEYLNKNDTLHIFYSDSCKSIRAEYMDQIVSTNCELRISKLINPRKNALDFYIAAECGLLCAEENRQLVLISNDKGFCSIVEYIRDNPRCKGVHISKACNIEAGILSLQNKEDAMRVNLIMKKSEQLGIEEQYAIICERKRICSNLREALKDTEYEGIEMEIEAHINENINSTRMNLYTDTLHRFGRKAGNGIYRIIRNVV